MARLSAGLLLYRRKRGEIEVFLVHPGGPFWAARDSGSWSIPKGEYVAGETPLEAARREFTEETGFAAPNRLDALGGQKQPGGKVVSVWAAEGDCDAALVRSNTCEIEWPPRSGRRMTIPEVDRGAWFSLEEARLRIFKGQVPFLDNLADLIGHG